MKQVNDYLSIAVISVIGFIIFVFWINKNYFHNRLGMLSPFIYFYVLTNVSNFVLMTKMRPNYKFVWRVTAECLMEIEKETPTLTVDRLFKQLEQHLILRIHRTNPKTHDLYMHDLALKNCRMWGNYMISRNKDDKFLTEYIVRVKAFRKAIVKHM